MGDGAASEMVVSAGGAADLLAAVGLCHVLLYAKILDRPRSSLRRWWARERAGPVSRLLLELSECSLCAGFWCGAATTLSWKGAFSAALLSYAADLWLTNVEEQNKAMEENRERRRVLWANNP